ncbi:MAG: hypothetical protein FJX57_16470, partial [Alphaproteobacteria bacterium]|nr:hypothetical protein [Alphaproteobacteria bacterium]
MALLLASSALVAPALVDTAPAQTKWVSPVSGDWNTAANWNTGVVPNGGVNVVIDVPAAILVTHSAGAHTIGTLTSQENFRITGGTLTINGTATLNGSFALSTGTLAGDGNVNVAGDFTWAGGLMTGSAFVTIEGSATLQALDKGLDAGRTLILKGGGSLFSSDLDLDPSNAVDGTKD